MKRSLKIILGGLAALLLAVGAAALLIDVDALVEAKKPELLDKASASLGRTVAVADIDARLFPDFGATLRGVKVAGRTPDEPALLEVGEAQLRFSLWKAITSLGKELEVIALELRGVKAHVARAADGSWSFDDILAREPEEPKEDEGPSDLSFLEGARVERAAILGADITLDDAQLGRPLKIEGTTLVLTDVRLGAPLAVTLETTLVDGDKRTPVSLAARLAELPKTLSFDPFPELSAALKMSALDVGPWGALLPRGALAPASGTLAADLKVDAGKNLTTFQGAGSLDARALVLAQAGQRGQPLDADVAFDVDVDTKAPRYLVRSLTVKGSGVDVKGSLEATSESLAGVKTADVQAKVQDLKRVLAVLPPGTAALPEELTLAGPLEARLTGNAESVDLSVNLDQARVAWGGSFDKAAGRALHVTLRGKKAGDVLAVEPFTLQVDTARITGKLGLPMNGDAPLTADIKSGPVTLSSLQGIIPPFAEALRKGDRVNGTFSLQATATAVGGKQDARVLVALESVDVNLAEASARGSGRVEAVLAPKEGVLDVRTVADLTGLALSSVGEGGAKVLDKPAGMPTRLEVEVTKTDQRADVRQALLAIGSTTVTAKGEATGLDGAAPKLNLDFGNVDVAFDDLRRTLPGAGTLPAGGRLRGQVKVTGSPEALSTLEVLAQNVDLAFGSSAVKGRIEVANLDAPRVNAKLPTLKVAFDDVRALADTDALPAGGRYEGGLDVTVDTANLSTLKADLQVSALHVGRSDMAGKASLSNLDRPTFAFDFSGQRVDIDELMKLFGADGEETAEEKPRSDDNPHGLSRDARDKLRRTNGQGSIRAKSVVFREIPMQDFVGRLTMKSGVAEFEALDFKLYGGAISAKGTTLDLPAQHTGYGLKLDVSRMDLGKALAAHTSLGGVFRGEVSNTIDLNGRGLTKRDLITTLTGPTMWRTDSLTIASLDVLTPIVNALEQVGKNVPGAPRLFKPAATGTSMTDMQAWLRFLGGKMELEKPITANTAFGSVTFTGQAFLDTRLDLGAHVKLSPSTIAQWTRNKVKPASAIEVPLRIGGTWLKPQVTGVDVTKLAQSIFGAAVSGALGEVADAASERAGQVVDQVREQVSGAQDEVDRRRKQAEDRAKKAADDARRAADDAKKRAEDEARKRADEAKKKADAAKKKAEEEAKKRAAAAKKKAEEEAKKRAAAAKKKAEEEARKRLGL